MRQIYTSWPETRGEYTLVMTDETKRAPTLKEIYPDATPEHLRELEDAIDRYIAMVMEIHDRIATDPVAYADLVTALTKKREEVGYNSRPFTSPNTPQI